MRLPALLLAAAAFAAPAALAQSPAAPPGGTPEVQAPAPELGSGRGGQPAGQPPETTEPQRPTGTPAAAPVPTGRPATPAPAAPAPPPFTDRGLPNAEELELQRRLQGGRIEGRITIPDPQAASLIQPAGRDWREFHNVTLAWIGGVAVLGMLAVLALFYATKGRMRVDGGLSGRTLLRFNALERANHWMVASSFIVLALTGLNLTFGRHLLLPIIGPEAFTAVSLWGKVAHNYLSFAFTLGIVVMLVLWVRDNIPGRVDWAWIRAGGGFLDGSHPAAGRFNAGQKLVFWITVLGGGLVAASGYVLLFPFAVTDVTGMQLAHIIHGALAVLMTGAMLAHIYIGSIGMEGAFDAMGSGRVDYAWARAHHSLWVDEELTRARESVGVAGDARAVGAG